MMLRTALASALVLLWFGPMAVSAKDGADSPAGSITLPPEKANPVQFTRFETPPTIDGRLDDAVWQKATVLKDFYQVQPGDNVKPSRETQVLLGYDSTHLYMAFRAFDDDKDKIRATIPKRDQIFADDFVGCYLDTFDDRRRAYILFFNPLGVQADGVFNEGNVENQEDYSVDLVFESKGTVDDEGFTVEVAIPFKSLRYVAGKERRWGAHFFRRIQRFDRELDSWMPLSREASGTLNKAGHLVGLDGISTERTLELIPSLTLSESGRRVSAFPPGQFSPLDQGRFVNDPIGFDPGLTLKYTLTPTVTLNFTANPDFAQVEADAPVITANQRFPIFYAEKRPFFLEGIEIFSTQSTIVHTRTIVDPDYAVKLTGKLGRTTFGLLGATDNAPGNYSEEEREDPTLLPSIERFLDKNSTVGVLRLKRDVGSESTLGLFATSYDFVDRHNRVAGVDGRFRLDKKTTTSFEVIATNTRAYFYDPNTDRYEYRTGNGFGYAWDVDYTGRNFGYNFNGRGRTTNYRADVGFTPRTNTNSETAFFRFSNDPRQDRTFISWRLMTISSTNFDWSGRMQNLNQAVRFITNWKYQTYLFLGTDVGYERLFEEEFGPKRSATQAGAFFGDDPERSARPWDVSFEVGTSPSEKVSGSVFMGTIRHAFDFDFGAGPRFPRVSPAALANPFAALDPGPGHTFDVFANISYTPFKALTTSLVYNKSKLTRDDTGLVAFDDNIFSLRSTYQFTRFTFARARIDYDTLEARARGQFLFGWTPNPGTSFYAGYNDDLNYRGYSPFTGRYEPGFQRNGRTFFIKMSYLLRMGV
jgi:hypothetical protein